MIVKCRECGLRYDDAERITYCPHKFLKTPEEFAQHDLAMSLMGKPLRWAHDLSGLGEPLYIESVDYQGMVSIKGWTGMFAPHVFVVRQ